MDVSVRVSLMWEEVPRENPHVQLGDEDTHSHKTVNHEDQPIGPTMRREWIVHTTSWTTPLFDKHKYQE